VRFPDGTESTVTLLGQPERDTLLAALDVEEGRWLVTEVGRPDDPAGLLYEVTVEDALPSSG
jgi:hypothetical protein